MAGLATNKRQAPRAGNARGDRSAHAWEITVNAQYLGHLSIPNRNLRTLCELWLAKRGSRPLPSRSEFGPGDIPAALWPMVMMLDVCRAQDRVRFRYRRVGMSFVEAVGSDPTGMFLDEVLPTPSAHTDFVSGLYLRAATRGCPIYSENLFTWGGRTGAKLTRRLILPLSHDGVEVAMLLAGHVFDYDTQQVLAMRASTAPRALEIVPNSTLSMVN